MSTQFPNPPELQPISAMRVKIWQTVSFLLTTAGLILIGAGVWIFVQQRIEANQPPPARILEVSVDDLDPTPTTTPAVATEAPLMATEESSILPTTDEPQPEPTSQARQPLVIPTLASADLLAPTKEIDLPVVTDLPEPTPGHVVGISEIENKLAEEAALSLADNPLWVAEVEDEPTVSEQLGTAKTVNESETSGSLLTRIVAESIELDSDVVEVGWTQVVQNGVIANVWTVADYAAGWHRNSALPGQGDNIVFSAHHNIKGEVFRYMVDLEPGDVVTLFDDDQAYDYIVEDKFIVKDKGEPEAVRRENAKWIGPFNEERLTLVTCWPYNTNTHRLIVIAKPVGEGI